MILIVEHGVKEFGIHVQSTIWLAHQSDCIQYKNKQAVRMRTACFILMKGMND